MLNEIEAKEYFDWFVKQCPIRSSYLLQKASCSGECCDWVIYTPGITGFFDKRFTPPFPMFFEPIHMTGVQAAKIRQGTGKTNDLFDLYMKWSEKSQ